MKTQTKLFTALVMTLLSSQVFAAETLTCIIDQTRTNSQGVEEGIHYKDLPDMKLRVKKCADPNCFYNSVEVHPELFPNILIDLEANTKGEINIRFDDHGDMNQKKGKVGYTSSTSSGYKHVLATYLVFSGDTYPMKMNSITVSCSSK